jgi:RNA polymerase sigma factor (sigma-70 family)
MTTLTARSAVSESKPSAGRLRMPRVMKRTPRETISGSAPADSAHAESAPAVGGHAGSAHADRDHREADLCDTGNTVEPEDAALVDLVAEGDQDALATLYQRHGSACFRLARQITASVTLAEDAVQEAFVGLWRAPGSYLRGRGSVRSWLLGLTHHKAVDLVRRETAEQRRRAAQAVQQTVDPPVSQDPASVAWTEIQAAEIRAALLELPEAQRRALTLAYFGGYTQSQIAELTGVPLGTVKTRMFSAMRRLRLRLAPLHGLPGEGAR